MNIHFTNIPNDEKYLLCRSYFGISNMLDGRVNMYIRTEEDAIKAFNLYSGLKNTTYLGLFKPKSKWKYRKQIRHYSNPINGRETI